MRKVKVLSRILMIVEERAGKVTSRRSSLLALGAAQEPASIGTA